MDNVIEGFKHNNLLGSGKKKNLKKGKGIIDKIKEFTKKHKKKIGAVALGTAALATGALGAYLHQKHKKPIPFGSHRSRLLIEPRNIIPPLENIPIRRLSVPSDEEQKRDKRTGLKIELLDNNSGSGLGKRKKGKGILNKAKEFFKKHKKKIAAAALGTAALGTAAVLGHKAYKRNQDFGRSMNPRHNIDTLPNISPIGWEDRAKESERNPLYFLDEEKGGGILNKAKEFVKKHKKKIAAISGAVLGTAALGTAAALGHKAYKKRKIDRELGRYLDLSQGSDNPKYHFLFLVILRAIPISIYKKPIENHSSSDKDVNTFHLICRNSWVS
jgi:hypothetical protein